jgi:hypothetical protein
MCTFDFRKSFFISVIKIEKLFLLVFPISQLTKIQGKNNEYNTKMKKKNIFSLNNMKIYLVQFEKKSNKIYSC